MSARLWTLQSVLNPSSGLLYRWETMEPITRGDSAHPLLLQLPWDACSCSLKERSFDVQKEDKEGRSGRESKFLTAFHVLPSSNKPALPGSATRGVLAVMVRDVVSSFCSFSFPLEVLFLMTGTKTGEIKNLRELSTRAAGSHL